MKEKQVNEVREHLAQYVTEASRGEEIVITRHSKPVAKLVTYHSVKSGLPDLSEFRKNLQVTGKPASQEVIESRREERN